MIPKTKLPKWQQGFRWIVVTFATGYIFFIGINLLMYTTLKITKENYMIALMGFCMIIVGGSSSEHVWMEIKQFLGDKNK